MKSNKGVTLISLTIYIIVMTIVVAVTATITGVFQKNLKDADVELDPYTEYIAFNSFFTEEIEKQGNIVLDCGKTDNGQNYIVFSTEVQYTFVPENKGIYRNKVKICRNIDNCEFSTENGQVIVKFVSGNYDKQTTYNLKN